MKESLLQAEGETQAIHQTEQRLEPNSEGLCNTLTSVQKDNYVLEIRVNED